MTFKVNTNIVLRSLLIAVSTTAAATTKIDLFSRTLASSAATSTAATKVNLLKSAFFVILLVIVAISTTTATTSKINLLKEPLTWSASTTAAAAAKGDILFQVSSKATASTTSTPMAVPLVNNSLGKQGSLFRRPTEAAVATPATTSATAAGSTSRAAYAVITEFQKVPGAGGLDEAEKHYLDQDA